MQNFTIFATVSTAQYRRDNYTKNQIIIFMKNFFTHFFAVIALVAGVATAACTPEDPLTPSADATVNVELVSADQISATLKITVQGISDFAYLMSDKDDLEAFQIIGSGEKVTVSDTSKPQSFDIKIEDLSPSTSYTLLVAAHVVGGEFYDEVVKTEFSTTGFGQALTVIEQMYDGFKVHLTIPEDVKQRGNAIRYTTACLPMFNLQLQREFFPQDMLMTNAGQVTETDKTIIYDEYHNVPRDANGDIIVGEDGLYETFSDPKTPGEPGVFLAGEFSWYHLQEYDPELGPGNKDTGPFGWGEGWFVAEYDYASFIPVWDSPDFEPLMSEQFWTGYYERIQVDCLPPQPMKGNVEIEVSDKKPIDALIRFTPDDSVLMYSLYIVEESEYQVNVLPLLDNNEEYMQWFTASYFAIFNGPTMTVTDGSATEIYLSDWYIDTKSYAGKSFRVFVTGMGDMYGHTQCFNTIQFTLPEKTLPAPEVTVTAVESSDPYSITFNIRNTSPDGQKITEAKFVCNYVREFNTILKSYSYNSLLEQLGYPFGPQEIQAINSSKGFDLTFTSRENATSRVAVLVYNWEGTSNNVNASMSPAVCEYTTPRAPYRPKVNSSLFTELLGEWEATASMRKYVASEDGNGGSWVADGTQTSPVTIAAGVEYPETLPNSVYDTYAKAGLSKSETDALYTEFKKLAKDYNNRTRGFNRLLCLGYNFTSEEYMLDLVATPFDLFCDEEYGAADLSSLFYDFGPKWNLEIDQDGSVWLPLDTEREFPMATWNFGMDYTFYMFGIGTETFISGPVYNKQGKLLTDARFPVEVSDDRNTITIKPIEYTDSNGKKETYYPCIAQLQNGQASPLMPCIGGDVVLKRKSGAKSSSTSITPRGSYEQAEAISGLNGYVAKPMARPHTMTPMDVELMVDYKRIELEERTEAGSEGFNKRVDKMFEELYGIK